MIKQIQLRGISRTPSDKMSEDGGLSESLNMYMDSAENAPAFVPEDKTAELGLPEDLYAERIFIHKTANYENYIVVQSDKVVAYTPGIEDEEPLLIMELAEGEKVNDITAVGNTLILSAGETLIYFLYKDREYKELNGIPDISLSVLASDALSVAGELNDNFPIRYTSITFEDAIFELGNESNNYTITDEQTLEKVSVIYDKYIEIVSHNLMLGTFNFPVFAIYATRLYDGTLINISSPIMLGTQLLNGTQGLIMKSPVIFTKERIQKAERDYDLVVRMYLNNPYHIGVYKNVPEVITEWRDIVSSVELFISPIYNILPMGKNHGKDDSEQFDTRDAFVLDPNNIENFKNKESLLLNNIYKKVKSWSIDELIDDDGSIEKIIMDFRGENISSKENLSDNVLVNQGVFAKNFLVYNRKLISYDSSVSVQNALPFLNGQHAYAGSRDDIEYAFSFFLNNGQIINAVDPSGQLYINANKGFYLGYKGAAISRIEGICEPFSWLSFPDSKCEKVRVYKKQDGVVKEVDLPMKIHPTAPNSAYAFLDYNTCLSELDYQESQGPQEQLKGKENKENVLFVSKVDNPFVFPLEYRYTFQSKVLGVAVATTALSQGQFGQFPLYVFTEDGIWAMETAADGSFVSQKPLSRDVCINPDSITSIDNAVVFVTAKGVMMIQGSQVMNISPYMNGKHFVPSKEIQDLISNQEGFCNLVSAISDEDSFMSFIKEAQVAYDYPGQRLIFINPSERNMQYIYKIDTQTWHKSMFEGLYLYRPLNSFPECLVQTEPTNKDTILIHFSSSSIKNKASMIMKFYERMNGKIGLKEAKGFIDGEVDLPIELQPIFQPILTDLAKEYSFAFALSKVKVVEGSTKVVSLTSILDDSIDQRTAKGVIITRPLDLGESDVYKTITDVRIRGQFAKGAVKFILLGSNNGNDFHVINTLRGKAWKLFRLVLLTDLQPTERISWIDVMYETKFKNRLR